jgi:hypothetical protein
MTETVAVIPTVGNDSNGDPVAQSEPITITPLEISPGNTAIRYGFGGDLTDVEFTIYLPLRVRTAVDTWTPTEDLVRNGDEIDIRGRRCVATVQVWRSQRSGRGGVAVLARSASGKAA